MTSNFYLCDQCRRLDCHVAELAGFVYCRLDGESHLLLAKVMHGESTTADVCADYEPREDK